MNKLLISTSVTALMLTTSSALAVVPTGVLSQDGMPTIGDCLESTSPGFAGSAGGGCTLASQAVVHVPNNAAMKALSGYGHAVREGYDAQYDAGFANFTLIGGGNCSDWGWYEDGGFCVNSNYAGYSWWWSPVGDPTLDLKNFGCKGDVGTPHTGTNDTACITAWLAALKGTGAKGFVPPGGYRIMSQLPSIDFPLRMFSPGKVSATFIADYNRPAPCGQGAGTYCVGVFNFTNGSMGSHVHSMSIQGEAGTSGGALITIVDQKNGQNCATVPSNCSPTTEGSKFESLWLTSRGICPTQCNNYINTIHIDGSFHADGAIGVRETFFQDVDVFGANGCSLYFKSAIGVTFIGGSVNAAGGTNTKSGAVCLDGGGVNSVTGTWVYSQYINIMTNSINGYIEVFNTLNSFIRSPAIGCVGTAPNCISVTNDAHSHHIKVEGQTDGIVQNAWIDSSFESNDGVRNRNMTLGGEFFLYPGGILEQWNYLQSNNAAVGNWYFQYTYLNPPRCVAQMVDSTFPSTPTPTLASIGTSSVTYWSSNTSLLYMAIRCIGKVSNSNLLPPSQVPNP